MDECIRILHLEDDAHDAELVQATLRSAEIACQIDRVQTRTECTQALRHGGYDVILADYRLPMYDGMSALRLSQELCPDVPFIFVSGTMGEDAAIEGLTEGATDYVLKHKLARLAPAVTRALREAENRNARKRAEAEIRTLSQAVEQSPATIIITDPAGDIQYINPRFTQQTGYTPDDVIGKTPRILKSGETPPEDYQRLWKTITHGDVWHGEFHNKQKNGDLYWELASISPVCDAQGAITHFVAVKEDITARKQTEEALRLLNEELELRVSQRTADIEAKNKELHEFAYIVSHDLKAPLRGIRRLTQWLQEDYAGALGAQGQKQLDLLGEQATRMDRLIDGILRYSRAGRSSDREEAIDLTTLVSQTIDMLMPPAHIAIRCEQPLPVIHGDPVLLTQVFQNLLSNAVKFMDKPAGAITVAGEDAGDMWIVRVADNGPGIDPRQHERIFNIFQSGAPRDDPDSTGIGLAVVKKIVECSGGRVWVESAPGHGSRFSFTWPKRRGEEG